MLYKVNWSQRSCSSLRWLSWTFPMVHTLGLVNQITRWYQLPGEINGPSLQCHKNASIVTELRSVKDLRGPCGVYVSVTGYPTPKVPSMTIYYCSASTVIELLALCCLLNSSCLSFALALQSFLWKCQGTVAAGSKNTRPSTMVCDVPLPATWSFWAFYSGAFLPVPFLSPWAMSC